MSFSFQMKIIMLSSNLLLSMALFAQVEIEPLLEIDQGRITQFSFNLEKLDSFNSQDLAFFIGTQVALEPNQPSILGQFELLNQSLSFHPQFSLEGGRFYTLQIHPEVKYTFWVNQLSAVVPKLTHIYPSSNQLPSNLLKFYLQFSSPMQPGKSYTKVALVNQGGDTLNAPFVALSPELWNDDFTRLTLWLDPGRIKRNLGPNQMLGPVLELNQTYELIIKSSWKDQGGRPLDKTYQKSFRVIPAERQKIMLKEWSLGIPEVKTSQALMIYFPKPMDAPLSQRMIQIITPDKRLLDGTFILTNEEKTLEVKPLKHWKPGVYQLKIDTYLEDICGNNLLRPFDRDLQKNSIPTQEKDFIFLSFEIKE